MRRSDPEHAPPTPHPGSAVEVLWAFLRLGLTSFGGPVAHLGYFRTEFVERRRWLDDRDYGDLVALCQFLPGPSSSQVGFALGLQRAGWLGGAAAWMGFTLPSVVAMVLLAQGVAGWSGLAASGMVQGLKLAAVAVVAQALWGMVQSLCPDTRRGSIAVLAALVVLAAPATAGPVVAILLGAVLGRFALPEPPPAPGSPTPGTGGLRASWLSRRGGVLLLALAAGLLVLLPAVAAWQASPAWSTVAVVYQAGSLVFGGGHVVLPLLQAGVVPPGWIGDDVFLAGYGAAQAVPGPLFSFAAYLGAAMPTLWSATGLSGPAAGWMGAFALTLALFLPGLLLVAGALPFWATLRQRPGLRRTLAGVNAAVVGLLGAAFYDPVWTSAIHTRTDLALALTAWALLVQARLSPLWVVILAAAAGWWMAAPP